MSPTTIRRIGLLLAAGRGRRMGQTKQLVLWRRPGGDVPLVAAAYDAVVRICDEMIVVLGHEAQAVAAALGASRPFHEVLSDPDAAMFESIRVGLEAAARIGARAVVVLQPGDHPEVAEATLESLMDAAARHPDRAVMPEYAGRGGHPVLIPPPVAREVKQADCAGGLREFWTTRPELCVRVPVDDAGVIRDVDTPQQLDR